MNNLLFDCVVKERTDISLFEQLQQLLLEEDREITQSMQERLFNSQQKITELQQALDGLQSNLTDLKSDLENPDRFEKKIDPLVEYKIAQLKANFKDIFHYDIQDAVKSELANSKEEVLKPCIRLWVK